MKRLLFILMGLTIISCSKKTTNTQKENVTKELDSLLLSTFKMDEPGGSVLLKKNGEIVFMKSYGVEDIKTGKKITENTIFNTGSISKTFVSNGILILQEQGKLSIEDSIYKYFKDFDNKEIAQKVKIKHMLSHTSGLPDLRNVKDNYEFFITAKDTANFEPIKRADSLNFESGERYQYSNPSYNGLALIIEGLAEKKWQDFIKENIFKPSGMKNSKITDGPHPETGVAHSYYKDDNGNYIEIDYGEVPTFAASGNGGIWSSVLELAKYEEAIRKNTFLSKELTEESRKPYYPKNWSDTIPPNIGYSWFTGDRRFVSEKTPSLDTNVIYHTGSQGGFTAFLISIPEKDIIFIGLFNKYRSKLNEIMNTTLQNLKENNWLD
ncbi:CubicO group peptidase (beta-lactamase class C family) [Tenacibaculum skagerrakense]|uniref:CubicO group peptidase (Beta-lactamase class C family) n=1 Tax=Tenacibaculum skagerrakense TaxID=186571 RepID=A0A4R2P2S5_9FLAO|nr:serine hydrolase domain-containing protein [Tenacibaculum skagerrakense]TCP28438.1 CubicO group peptidase (beta-lactamase class C family) [Tenacibaculum skagerrakense]